MRLQVRNAAVVFVVGVLVLGVRYTNAIDILQSGAVTGTDYSPAGLNLGTAGFWFANFNAAAGVNDASPEQDAIDQLPSYATQTFGDTIDSAGGWGGYADLTLPDGTVGNSGALEMNNAFLPTNQEEYMTLTFGAGVPANLRLGVVIDNTDGLQFSNGEIIVNGVTTGPLTNDLVPEVYFFDMFNVASGDTVMIEGTSLNTSVSHLGGILLDEFQSLNLEVNTISGATRLVAPTAGDIDVTGYTITSAAGSLNPGGWSPLEGSGLGNGVPTDGIGWEKLGDGLSTKVGEFNLTGSTVFGVSGQGDMSLGSLFTPSATEDLLFQTSTSGGGLVSGFVTYTDFVTEIEGDYNGDSVVNAADYVVWRDSLGDMGASLPADGNGDEVVNQDDYSYWKSRFGNTAGAGSGITTSVPEPTTLLTLVVGGLLFGTYCRSRGRRLAVVVSATTMLCATTVFATVTVDRSYLLGDNSDEGAIAGAMVGSGNSFGLSFDDVGTSGAGDLQDVSPTGTVNYADVSSRPGAGAGTLGAAFGGGYLTSIPGVGYPGSDPPPNPVADYSGITQRGMQAWVMPTGASGALQEIINDTYQFGVRITANNTWGMVWGAADGATTVGRAFDSGVPVAFNQWHHVHQHSFGNNFGVLYVDGVATAASAAGNIYQLAGAGLIDLTVGGSVNTLGTDTFTGVIDDMEIYVSGTSTATSADYGTFNLGQDSQYIASLGLTEGDLTGDDLVNDDDVDVIISNWRSEQLVAGQRIGDINSRMSGDFDFDGFVGLLDWHVIRETHVDGASLNLAALLAGAGQVPEPGTIVLLVAGASALMVFRRRRKLVGVVLFALLACTNSAVIAADLWNVDFQGDVNGTIFGQTATQKNYGPDLDGIWNHFEVHGLDNDVAQTAFTTDPSLNLVDNDGAASPITVSLTGDYGGWNGDTNPDFLTGDYIILLGSGTLGYPAPPMNMTISGLTPGVEYGFRLITGSESAARHVATTIDTNGDGSLADEETIVAPSGGVRTSLSFTAGASGELIATMDLSTANEANVAGIQLKVGDFNPILQINRETGQMTLTNNTDATLPVTAYLIESNTAGALNPAEWLSIADNYDVDSDMSVDDTGIWTEFTQPNERDNFSEVQDVGASGFEFVDGQSIDLGPSWIRNTLEDVTMQLLLENGTLQDVDVRFVGGDLIVGDLDFDRDVDLDDWALVKTGFSTDITDKSLAEKSGLGDLNSDGLINLVDVGAFGAAFNAAAGAGAFQLAITGAAVPEPSTIASLWVLLGTLASYRRQYQRPGAVQRGE